MLIHPWDAAISDTEWRNWLKISTRSASLPHGICMRLAWNWMQVSRAGPASG
jgi:hypothetical protein